MKVILALAGVAFASAAQVTPLQKVISLLEDMKAKGIKEKQDEEVRMSAFNQWCDNTKRDRENQITKGKDLIDELAATIEKEDTTANNMAERIAELEEDVGRWTADTKAATDVRNSEKLDFDATVTDLSETLSALERAIAVLKKKNVKVAQAELLQSELSFIQTQAVSKVTVRSTMNALQKFLQPAQAIDMTNEKIRSDQVAYGYEGQSGGVIDMLEELEDKFKKQKYDLEKEELNAKNAFQVMAQTLADEIENANTEIKRKTSYKEAALKAKAEAEGDKADAEAVLAADQKYLADATTECKLKNEAFVSRQELRAGEIEAVDKAIEILSANNVSGAADRNLPGFLQMSSKVQKRSFNAGNSAIQKVAALLQERARENKSQLLSALATRASSESGKEYGDPFLKVKKMIKDMISRLNQEATAEAEHKGWCDAELGANKIQREAAQEEVDSLTAEKEELTATIASLAQDIADLTDAIAALDKAMAEATAQRTEEKAANLLKIQEAKDAQVAVEKAVEVLKEFYAKASEATAFIQLSQPVEPIDPASRIAQTATGTEAGVDAPETFRSDVAYKGLGGENGNVLDFLEVILGDFARLESETTSDEEMAASEYTTFMNDSEVDKATKSAEVKHKTETKTRKEADLNTCKKDLKAEMEALAAAKAYYQKLKPSCVDSGASYEERVKRREAEMQSLNEALEILKAQNV